MTCKDCVHYDVCEAEVEARHDNLIELETEGIEDFCDHFKPKSRFVELPCEVGGYMYTLSRGKAKKWKVCFAGLNSQGEQKYHLADEGFKNMIEAWSYDIGKNVFLSREEAEKALKERESE